MNKSGSQNGSFVLIYYWGWVKVEQAAEKVETVEVKVMVAYVDLVEVMMVEALGKVHMQEDMIAQVHDRNYVNDLALSILVSTIGRVVHIDIDFHVASAESDQCQGRNTSVHYNQKNVVEVQEQYLHLHEANSFVLPQHAMIQLQAVPLKVQLSVQVWRDICLQHGYLHKFHICSFL